jgi:hypothetical protein
MFHPRQGHLDKCHRGNIFFWTARIITRQGAQVLVQVWCYWERAHESAAPKFKLHSAAGALWGLNAAPEDIGKTDVVYATMVEAGQIHIDLTGSFPTTSAKGNKYFLVLYEYDTNNILTEPMKNRGDKYMVRAYNKLIQELIDNGFKPPLQRLDNECYQALRSLLNQHDIQFQLAPRHIHRRNAA